MVENLGLLFGFCFVVTCLLAGCSIVCFGVLGLVVCLSIGLVVWWFGGLVVWWFGGLVVWSAVGFWLSGSVVISESVFD